MEKLENLKSFCEGCKRLGHDCKGLGKDTVWTGCARRKEPEKEEN